MTVCAVHVYDNDIIMGADGLISNKYDIIDEQAIKIHRLYEGSDTELMYSLAGSDGLIAAFHHRLLIETHSPRWVYNPKIRKENYIDCLEKFVDSFIEEYAKIYPDEALHCLIASKQHFCCHKIVQHSVREIKTGQYAAIGCGDDFAMGALYNGSTIGDAIDAACKHSLHCGGTCMTCLMRK